MQQGRGGGGGGGMPSASEQVVEEASPISSRPPAENLEEVMRFSAEEAVGSGGSSGNRWPREETLALLRIRSEMDSTFRDATVKGPLWEDVSRKLAELGYKRSAMKCKEKFENVHKYHKRTKEGKSGRQDGKTYKFFTQLEALNTAATPPPQPQSQPPPQSQQQLQSQSQPQPQLQLQPQQQAQTQSHPQPQSQSQSQSQLKLKLQSQPQSKTQTQVQPRPPAATLNVTPLSVGIPPPDHIQLSSQRIITNTPPSSSQPLSVLGMPTSSSYGQFRATTAAAVPTPVSFGFTSTTTAAAVPTASSYGITFSSHSSSTASSSGFDDDEMEDIAGPSNVKSRKRKRRPARGGSRMMMELFENLMRRVMEKQESMQRSFLETIERRNRERINREEAWRRQESTRLAREDELMAQERSTTAARDAAIISLIQNITGRHTIHFPPPAPQAAAAAATTTTPPIHQPISSPLQKSQNQPATLMAIPEQGTASPSSRWPKSEVIALINLRSGLETKYQDSGAKAPLWEEISAGMKRMGYNRNAKRCKEKWENINKYYKKVKESSNKKRPEDAKTCPYFHQLDALYRNRVIGGTITLNTPHQHEQISLRMSNPSMENVKADEGFTANPRKETRVIAQMSGSGGRESKTGGEESGSLFGVGNQGAVKKPEDHLRVLMGQQGKILQEQQPLTMHDCDNIDEPHSYNLDLEEEDNDEEDEEEPDEDENGKRNYKMEFQQRNTTNTPNREGNNGPSSFFTMVQ